MMYEETVKKLSRNWIKKHLINKEDINNNR